jgi:hypothetical protein
MDGAVANIQDDCILSCGRSLAADPASPSAGVRALNLKLSGSKLLGLWLHVKFRVFSSPSSTAEMLAMQPLGFTMPPVAPLKRTAN